MPIGQCDACGRDILAPGETLIWAEDRSYHQDCYQTHLAKQISEEINA